MRLTSWLFYAALLVVILFCIGHLSAQEPAAAQTPPPAVAASLKQAELEKRVAQLEATVREIGRRVFPTATSREFAREQRALYSKFCEERGLKFSHLDAAGDGKDARVICQ